MYGSKWAVQAVRSRSTTLNRSPSALQAHAAIEHVSMITPLQHGEPTPTRANDSVKGSLENTFAGAEIVPMFFTTPSSTISGCDRNGAPSMVAKCALVKECVGETRGVTVEW